MSSSSENPTHRAFLDRLRRSAPTPLPLPPAYERPPTSEVDLLAMFRATTARVGGTVHHLEHPEQLHAFLDARASPDERLVAPGLPATGRRIDASDDAASLESVHTVVLSGDVAVAEDGAVLVSGLDDLGASSNRLRGSAFLALHLILVVDRADLVPTLHEAFARDTVQTILRESPFSVWISGPSKTADIEQTLVHGAHGAKRVTVVVVGP